MHIPDKDILGNDNGPFGKYIDFKHDGILCVHDVESFFCMLLNAPIVTEGIIYEHFRERMSEDEQSSSMLGANRPDTSQFKKDVYSNFSSLSTFSLDEFKHTVDSLIEHKRLNPDDYDSWRNIGFALAHEVKEGRVSEERAKEYFLDDFSSNALGNYDRVENERHWKNFINSSNNNPITIATFIKQYNELRASNVESKVDSYINEPEGSSLDFPKEACVDEVMAYMKLYAAILNSGGKVEVFSKVTGSLQSVAEFHKRFANTRVKGLEKKRSKAYSQYWFEHPEREEYEKLTFEPSKPRIVDGNYNTWSGFPFKPVQGNHDMITQYIHEVVCSGDAIKFEYVMSYLSHLVQKPEELPRIAIVLYGGKGAGKSTFGYLIARLVGKKHLYQTSNDTALTARFNSPLKHKLLVVNEESGMSTKKDVAPIYL